MTDRLWLSRMSDRNTVPKVHYLKVHYLAVHIIVEYPLPNFEVYHNG